MNDPKRLELVQKVDALIALIRSKMMPVIEKIKQGQFDAKLSADVIKINNVRCDRACVSIRVTLIAVWCLFARCFSHH